MARSHHGWRGLSHAALAERAGLARSTVAKISKRRTWAGLTIEVIDRFAFACGVDVLHPREAARLIRSRKKPFLAKAPPAQRRFYLRLFKLAA